MALPPQLAASLARLQAATKMITGATCTVAPPNPPPVPTHLSITTQPPSTGTSGVALSPAPAVQLLDANNAPVHTAGVSITVVENSGTSSLGGTLVATTNANGLATFPNLVLTGNSTDTLLFSSTGLTGVVSTSVTVTGGGIEPPLSLYFNSTEPGGDGSDPNVLWADDLQRGYWFMSIPGPPPIVANAGWNPTGFGAPDPQGTNFGRIGTGVASRNCISNGGHFTPLVNATTITNGEWYEIVTVGTTNYTLVGSPNNTVGTIFQSTGIGTGTGTVNHWLIGQAHGMADHQLASSTTEVYFRYYVKPVSPYYFAQEKTLTFNKGVAGFGGIYAGCLFWGLNAPTLTGPAPTFYDANGPGGVVNRAQNQGVTYHLVPDHWNCIQVHIKFVAPGSDVLEAWMDDCGVDGTAHPSAPTLRMQYTNLTLRPAGDNTPSILSINMENWANPPVKGETLYNWIMCKKTGPIGFAVLPPTTIYSTTFPTVEDPIAQGSPSKWLNGLANGVDWNNMQVSPNGAIGESDTFYINSPVADDIAQLTTAVHTFAPAQFIQAVAYKAAGYGGGAGNWAHEIEMHLHQTISAKNIVGYECSIGINAAGQTYAFIVRWRGAIADYVTLKDPSGGIGTYVNTPTPLANGDVMYCSITAAGLITLSQNGRTLITVTDTNLASGQPGMGAWPVHGADKTKMGWSSWQAGEL